jgi:hypothetical protein
MKSNKAVSHLVVGVLAIVAMISSSMAAASTDNGTLTAGSTSGGCPPGPRSGTFTILGFINGSLGSYTPTGLTGGETLLAITDEHPVSCGGSISTLSVKGFSANPGAGWLTSITCDSVERLESSAISYTYTSSTGVAAWQFSGNFGFTNGGQVACSITHS